jgi:hypothetical protein
MKRRTAIKQLIIVTGGALIIPSCFQKDNNTSIPLNNLKFKRKDEQLLAEIGETILPASDTPGAKDAYAHIYAMKVVDDCYDKEAQETFVKGLEKVEEMAKKNYNQPFVNCTTQQKQELIKNLESKNAPEEALKFYKQMKSLTIEGWQTSKPVLIPILKYEMAPGRYNGFASVNSKIPA